MAPPRKKSLSTLLTAEEKLALGCRALSTEDRPVTPELVRAEPNITHHLRQLSDSLLKEITVTKETVGDDGKKVFIKESIFPFGIEPNILKSWPKLLKLSDLPDAKRIANLYESLKQDQAESLPVEAYCYAASISPMRILEILTGILVRQGAQASTILAAVWHPRVVQKTVEMALTDEGVSDRATIHKATGFVPMPKGSSTIINVQQNASSQKTVAFVPAPSPEATVRQLADTFNEARGLPATTELTYAAIEDVPEIDDEDDESV